MPYSAVATIELTHGGIGMNASSSRRRYSTFFSSKSTVPASVAIPEVVMPWTVRWAARKSSKAKKAANSASGLGTSSNVASVTMPRVP